MKRIKRYYSIVYIMTICSFGNSVIGQSIIVTGKPASGSFPLLTNTSKSVIYYDASEAKVVGIAATAFKDDVKAITGSLLQTSSSQDIETEYAVIAGTIGRSSMIKDLVEKKLIDVSAIRDQWERFMIVVVNKPYKKAKKLLVIAGSDRRGTAYGLFHLSRLMGVSPFAWWADVAPAKQEQLFVSGSYVSNEPSVKYRGIFINDEDWGLQPWAARNLDTDIKDIGPKTYAKVFELMLRLKANYIWPAMHPCTRAFYYYEDNPKVADDYAIIVGGSHCEPMLRNNVFEWAENFEHEYGKKPGEWRYDLNKDEMYKYWDDRVKQAVNYESIYTVGMRGIHDGSMPGPKDPDQKLKLLENVIIDQRKILQQNFRTLSSDVPQIFVPYKEVLSLYQRGLPLADDITIIWPDDNHGYIRQLPDSNERKRSGGHGVYYHLSYWGSPHDYLWLSSISPSLIAYEMSKAYYYGAKKLWVFNVGDIKPAELELQFAMDMAWDIKKYDLYSADKYLYEWAAEIFGEENAARIAAIKKSYYSLAQESKPEHLGMVDFSTEVANKRLAAYADIVKKVKQLRSKIPARLSDAYFQLLEYPVTSASLMNQKVFFEKRSGRLLTKGNQSEAKEYFDRATTAFDSIKLLTDQYNNTIAGGKWNGIMSWHPRDLKVFNAPKFVDTTKKILDSSKAELISILTPANFDGDARTSLKETEGVGLPGKAITLLPKDLSKWPDLKVSPNATISCMIELKPGHYTVVVKWLPTFNVSKNKKLEYAIGFNDDKSKTVNVHADAESAAWKENVLRGYSMGQTLHVIDKAGMAEINITIKDINMVLMGVEIYRATDAK